MAKTFFAFHHDHTAEIKQDIALVCQVEDVRWMRIEAYMGQYALRVCASTPEGNGCEMLLESALDYIGAVAAMYRYVKQLTLFGHQPAFEVNGIYVGYTRHLSWDQLTFATVDGVYPGQREERTIWRSLRLCFTDGELTLSVPEHVVAEVMHKVRLVTNTFTADDACQVTAEARERTSGDLTQKEDAGFRHVDETVTLAAPTTTTKLPRDTASQTTTSPASKATSAKPVRTRNRQRVQTK